MSDVVKVGITGHQGLTEHTEAMVRESISDYLEAKEGLIGITSLAEGADQIFAEEVLRLGGELEIVIPSENYESSFQSPGALANYKRVAALAKRVIKLGFANPSQEAYWEAGKKIADDADELIAVWNGQQAVGLGGTGDVVSYAISAGKLITRIWPEGASRKSDT